MNGMIPLATLETLFDYNYWARDRQLEACAALTSEQFLRPIGGSFRSIRDTLAHLVAVEWIWLERWRGRSRTDLIAPADLPTTAAVTERWTGVEHEMRDYLAGLDESALSSTQTYLSTRGERWTYPLWQMITHLLDHQTYHRGQVTMLLRMLGAVPPRIDFLVWQDSI